MDSPLKTPYFKLEPEESSLDGPCADSGDRLDGAGIGGLPLDGNIPGDPAGVAELEGMPAGSEGVAAISGASATGETPTGLFAGAVTGVLAGEAMVGGGVGGD